MCSIVGATVTVHQFFCILYCFCSWVSLWIWSAASEWYVRLQTLHIFPLLPCFTFICSLAPPLLLNVLSQTVQSNIFSTKMYWSYLYMWLTSCLLIKFYILLKKSLESLTIYNLCTYDFKLPQLSLTRRKLYETIKTSVGMQKHI